MLRCTVCGQEKILRNAEQVCIFCPSKQPAKVDKNYKTPIDPGEKEMQELLTKGKVPTLVPEKLSYKAKILLPNEGSTVKAALDIMKALSMPKDIKQFKQIQKIIKLLEKLIGETNAIRSI
jgi:hypothetical protein